MLQTKPLLFHVCCPPHMHFPRSQSGDRLAKPLASLRRHSLSLSPVLFLRLFSKPSLMLEHLNMQERLQFNQTLISVCSVVLHTYQRCLALISTLFIFVLISWFRGLREETYEYILLKVDASLILGFIL